MLKVILVASGKGGTGKTSLTAGVGAALAANGHRVLVIDGDCGLRNLDIVLGMSDRVVYSFADVAGGMVQLADAMARHPVYETLYLLTAPVRLPALSERGMDQLAKQAEQAGFDYLIIDGPAGLPAEMSFLAHIATQAIIVTATDRACVRGAERCARTIGSQVAFVHRVVDVARAAAADELSDARRLSTMRMRWMQYSCSMVRAQRSAPRTQARSVAVTMMACVAICARKDISAGSPAGPSMMR